MWWPVPFLQCGHSVPDVAGSGLSLDDLRRCLRLGVPLVCYGFGVCYRLGTVVPVEGGDHPLGVLVGGLVAGGDGFGQARLLFVVVASEALFVDPCAGVVGLRLGAGGVVPGECLLRLGLLLFPQRRYGGRPVRLLPGGSRPVVTALRALSSCTWL